MRKNSLLFFVLLSLVTAAQPNIINVTYDIKGRENTGYTSYQVSTSAPSRLKIFVRNKTEMPNVSASSGEQFSVSSLPRGYHILFITLRDGRIFNSKFVKR